MREMDPDAVVREAESGRSLAGDDAVRGADYLVSVPLYFGLVSFPRHSLARMPTPQHTAA